jgi:hypothetical protein
MQYGTAGEVFICAFIAASFFSDERLLFRENKVDTS